MDKVKQAIKVGEVEEKSDGNYYCIVCQADYKKGSIKKHLETQKHQDNRNSNHGSQSASAVSTNTKVRSQKNNGGAVDDVRQLDLPGAIEMRSNGKYFCNACQRDYQKGSIQRHLNTQKHLDNMRSNQCTQPASAQSRGTDQVRSQKNNGGAVDNVQQPDLPGEIEMRSNGKYFCNACQRDYQKGSIQRHLTTQKHRDNMRSNQCTQPASAQSRGTDQQLPARAKTGASIQGGRRWKPCQEFDTVDPVGEAIQDGILKVCRDDNYPFWCAACEQHLKIEGKLEAHISSEKHNSNLSRFLKEEGRDEYTSESEESSESDTDSEPCGARSLSRHMNRTHNFGLSATKAIRASRNINLDVDQRNTSVSRRRKDIDTDFEYDISPNMRKLVHVFNVLTNRPGAEIDSKNIESTFSGLGYEVTIPKNPTKDGITRAMRKLRNDRSLKDVGVLIIFILAHGDDKDHFLASDNGKVNIDELKSYLTDKNCAQLKGKPKLIMTNYCRGNLIEFDKPMKGEIPLDMAVVNAANEEFMCVRKIDCGTIFVKSLCEILGDPKQSKEFEKVFIKLKESMKAKGGTTPESILYKFKSFTF